MQQEGPAENVEPGLNFNGFDVDENALWEQFYQDLCKYGPFLLILLAKDVYDYLDSIFVLMILFTTFYHSNSTVTNETTKRENRNLVVLSIELLLIFVCSVFVSYIVEDKLDEIDVVLYLVLIRKFTNVYTVGKTLWTVTITDFELKLVTVVIKAVLTMLPGRIFPFQKRGKLYLFIEATSQMYRSIVTIQPWLHYLLGPYQGFEKVVAIFLLTLYMMFKEIDVMARMEFFKTSFLKLIKNMPVGSSPSREQIETAGDHCPICHDNYDSPVLLHCNHIFCENCVMRWCDLQQTCPLCRAKIAYDPSWKNGSTSYFMQLY